MSMMPGARQSPPRSTRPAPPRVRSAPAAMILPSSTSTSPLPSRLLAGSSSRALVKSVVMAPAGSSCRRDVARLLAQGFEHRHAYRDAHLDLLAHEAAVDIVSDFSIDLDAAVHRTGMHDQRIRLGERELFVIEAE